MNDTVQEQRSGLDVIARVLADEGIDIVFGQCGTILPARDAVSRFSDIHRAPAARQGAVGASAREQGAGFNAAGVMATAYARASRKVGVMVSSGPGAAETLAVLAGVGGDPAPIVLLCSRCLPAAERDAAHPKPHGAKRVFVVADAAGLEVALRAAFAIARAGRPGPVLVDIPRHVQGPF
jgi:acetolactate synthase-1/2/3 large subunit